VAFPTTEALTILSIFRSVDFRTRMLGRRSGPEDGTLLGAQQSFSPLTLSVSLSRSERVLQTEVSLRQNLGNLKMPPHRRVCFLHNHLLDLDSARTLEET
jgi:hypothetical protein